MHRTLEQKRAHFALKFIKSFQNDASENGDLPRIDKDFRAKLNTFIHKAPVQILQNGLGQMLAYLLADNEGKSGSKRKASKVLYDHLQDWLCGRRDNDHPCRVYESSDLMEQITLNSRHHYLQAQKETLALFAWLKKFSDAWLSEE